MNRARFLAVSFAVIAGGVIAAVTLAPLETPARPAHHFVKVAEGVYAALATGALATGSNSAIIVNSEDTVAVDSHITPAAARALVSEARTLTDKPVRFVVNTHFHFDHAHGNQIFPDDVLIIGHEFTRAKLAGDPLNEPSFRSFTGGVPVQVEDLRKQVAAETDPAKKAALEERLSVQSAYADALKEVRPLAPNVTVNSRMTLFRGGREIRILYFGRGHTGGDVVVYLPKEKVLCAGDLITGTPGFMGDAFLEDWVATLDELKKLDFEVIVPGHGDVIQGGEVGRLHIGKLQSYIRDLRKQALDLRSQGVSAADAAKRIDLTSHKADFPALTGPGVDPRAVARVYQLAGEAAAPINR